MPPPRDKWTAFLLSLAVPGVGQLWAGSFTCLAWFVAAGGVAAFWLALADGFDGRALQLLLVGQFLSLALVGVCSAEHAKRLLELTARPRRRDFGTHVCGMQRRGRAIQVQIVLDVPMSVAELWRRVANLDRFLTIDPFHERVVLMRDAPAAGVNLVLWHNAFGRRFARFGRILSWHEGEGYAFSDLSAGGPRRGFPHIFCVSVLPANDGRGQASRLSIAVRGKWTSRIVPTTIGRWWIWLVCREHARLLRKGL